MADHKPYLIVNIILAGIIGIILIYSGLFSAQKGNHPLPSIYEIITKQPAPSSGMSRAFSEIIRGNLDSAREYNPDSPLVFAFFLIQGLQRISVSSLLLKSRLKKKHLLIADVFITATLFLYCFQGQIRAMIRLLHES
ncbi:DUF2752 domain-containing protein [Bacteroidota bacterium]